MRLRKLEQRDAERMLAWMHDAFVVEKLQTNFADKTIENCREFIDNSEDENNIHLAITDDNDVYMGTVSLKHIKKNSAEFAITVCREAMGRGYSLWAMREIINIGFEKYGVSTIFWCVAPENIRAVRFYDKNKFLRVNAGEITECIEGYSREQIEKYLWYKIDRD